MSYQPTFATLHHIEIQKLAELKAGGTIWAVVAALNSFAQNKTSCFPSIQTIMDYLGGAYGRRAIHRALKWLEDNELIVRNHRRSKSRFVLKLRALAYSGIEALKRKSDKRHTAYSASNDPRKEQEKNHSFFSNRRSQSSPERSKSRPFWAKKKPKNRVGGKWGLPDYEPDKRPQIEQDCDRILTFYFTSGGTHQFSPDEINTLQTRCQADADYRAWMFEHNQQVAELVGLE
jgi:hypothetical protein